LRRYLFSYAPATLTDFAYWSGLRVHQARAAAEEVASELCEVLVEGRRAWILRKDLATLGRARPDPPPRLLPHFDTSLLAHRAKGHYLDPRFYKQVYRNAGWISPTILIGGRVAGTWSYVRTGSALRVTLAPFRPIPRAARAELRAEVESLARFLGSRAGFMRG
jgi:hypothetical protein